MVVPNAKLWLEPNVPSLPLWLHDSLLETLPLAPLSQSVPSHCSPQCRGTCSSLTAWPWRWRHYELSNIGSSLSIVTALRTEDWVSRRTSQSRGWCLTFCDLRSMYDAFICDSCCTRGVAVCSPAGCGAAELTRLTWLVTLTFNDTKTKFTWFNWRTLCGSAVRDHARDDKCYEDSWRKARHGLCDPLRTVRSSWKWEQYHSSTIVLNRTLMGLKRPGRETYC